jgi:hypothetical protein
MRPPVCSLGAGKRERVGTSPGTWKPTSALKRTGLADAERQHLDRVSVPTGVDDVISSR